MAKTPRILLVEDDPEQSILFTNVLAIVGYNVVATLDAETALARMTESAFNLVLVDWDLPGMRGDDFIRLVQLRYRGVKTVLFSNDANVGEGAHACHADTWMVKGEGIMRLREIIAGLLRAD